MCEAPNGILGRLLQFSKIAYVLCAAQVQCLTPLHLVGKILRRLTILHQGHIYRDIQLTILHQLYKISENVKLAQMKLTVEELAQKLVEPDISTPCMCSTWRWLWPWGCPRPCLWHGHAGG